MSEITKKKSIFLTFDDGPRPGTDDVISVLSSKQVKGTLFMVGIHKTGKWRIAQVFRAHKNAFTEVANHSYTHANNQYLEYYKAPKKVVLGFEKAEKTLYLRNKIARLPGRNTWNIGGIRKSDGQSGIAAAQLRLKGYKIFGWDEEWHMKNNQPIESPKQMIEIVKKRFDRNDTQSPDKMVVLMHDQMFRRSENNTKKLEEFIDLLLEQSFEMKFLSEY